MFLIKRGILAFDDEVYTVCFYNDLFFLNWKSLVSNVYLKTVSSIFFFLLFFTFFFAVVYKSKNLITFCSNLINLVHYQCPFTQFVTTENSFSVIISFSPVFPPHSLLPLISTTRKITNPIIILFAFFFIQLFSAFSFNFFQFCLFFFCFFLFFLYSLFYFFFFLSFFIISFCFPFL